jgi:pimeloyl-ACP methyl ester carboxylesterase
MIPERSHGGARAIPVGLALLTVLAACVRPLPPERPATPPRSPLAVASSSPPAVAQPRGPSPIAPDPPEAEPGMIDLPVEGHRPAVVSIPLGATSPRPILVIAHGAGGRPEPHCDFWRSILGARGFLLCPRGVLLGAYAAPADQGYFYPDHHALEREVTAALAALRARFGDRLDDRAPIYVGFSQGATMGALAFVKRPAAFARLILIEGGVGESDEWTINGARAFHEGGAERVLFACGRVSCFTAARRSLTYLGKAGLEGRVVHGAGAGHTYGGAVADAVIRALPWVLEGDPRWSDG